jgi:hypothetical protein
MGELTPGSLSTHRPALLALAALALALAVACQGSGSKPAAVQAAGGDADGGAAPLPPPDAGAPDAGAPDGGSPDGGVTLGGVGPWPVANQTFGGAEGITEGPVVATSTDEAQNLWVATPVAIYLMKPGDKAFRRYSSKDGLHLSDNPVIYNEDSCAGERGVPGSATGDGISTIVGGAAGEVFVGYHGVAAVVGDCSDPAWQRHSGKLDRVRLQPHGTIEVKRLDMVATGMGMNFWHNRGVWRMAYDHVIHPHTLYVGTDHGVDMMLPDHYRDPAPGEWTGFPIQEWMSDHLHVQVCFHGDATCLAGGEGNSRMGDWRGLAIAPDGDLWHAGRWSAGKIAWVADLTVWNKRAGAAAYPEAFGNDGSPPVFPVAQVGDVVSLSAVAETPDGTAWFSSAWFYGTLPSEPGPGSGRGLAAWSHPAGHGGKFTYYSPFQTGMSEQDIQDMVALPDGRLVLAGPGTGLVFWNPTTNEHKVMRAGQGIPDDRVLQLELDTMVDPPALHVSTAGGAATIRVFP